MMAIMVPYCKYAENKEVGLEPIWTTPAQSGHVLQNKFNNLI